MSKELFQFIQGMGWENIETQLALQCAPLITGIKISNILIIQKVNLKKVEDLLKDTCISYFKLYESGEKTTLLLYKEQELLDYLAQNEVQNLMRRFGHQEMKLNDIVKLLRERYAAYMKKETEFPHELGLMLGYPVEDVTGFIEHNGKNYLHSGYWKVYKNPIAKRQLFEKFEQAKENVIQLVSTGVSIVEVIDIYLEDHRKRAV